MSKIDMGPPTMEGDTYHAKFSVDMLAKRVKAKQQEKHKAASPSEFTDIFHSIYFEYYFSIL